jgi:outer membrane protein assembly factor BamB
MTYLKYTAFLMIIALTSCSDFGANKEKLKGERISAYAIKPSINIDVSTKKYKTPAAISVNWSTSKYPDGAFGNNLSLPLEQLNQIHSYRISSSKYTGSNNPLISDNKIVIFDNSGEISAADFSTGKTLWKNKDLIKDPTLSKLITKKKVLYGGMIQHEGKIFLTGGFKGVLAIDLSTGRTLWCKEISTMTRGVPQYKNGAILVQATNSNIYALDAITGKLLWSYLGMKASEVIPLDPPTIAVEKNLVASIQGGNSILSLDIKSGEPLWEVSFYEGYEENSISDSINRLQPHISKYNGTIYAIHPNGRLLAISPEDGAIIWKHDLNSGNDFWIAGDLLFIASLDNNLIAIDRHDGKVKWVANISSILPKAEPGKTAVNWIYQPIVANGEVLLASTNGQIHRFNYVTGQHIGMTKLAKSLQKPVIIAKNQLFIIGKNAIEQYSTTTKKS